MEEIHPYFDKPDPRAILTLAKTDQMPFNLTLRITVSLGEWPLKYCNLMIGGPEILASDV
jgi:hypothetical protein